MASTRRNASKKNFRLGHIAGGGILDGPNERQCLDESARGEADPEDPLRSNPDAAEWLELG
jgi:hypothetical protein